MGFFFNENKQSKENSQTKEFYQTEPVKAPQPEEFVMSSQKTEARPIAEPTSFATVGENAKSQPIADEDSSANIVCMDTIVEQLKDLSLRVKQLTSQNGMKAKIEEKEEIIKLQHNQLIKFQDDLLWRSSKDYILEMIGIADNIRVIIDKQEESKEQQNKDELHAELLDDVRGLLMWVESVLANNGVNSFKDVDANPQTFNPKRQKIVDVESVQDPSLSGSYKSSQPGYEWSIPYLVVKSDVQLQKIIDENKVPQKLGFVIRPEEVVKLK